MPIPSVAPYAEDGEKAMSSGTPIQQGDFAGR
jgi:hypothetical protein